MFELITPLSYWVLAGLWLVILGLYLAKLRHLRTSNRAIAVLLTILALDAFRTLFESAYFGLYFNAQFGILPRGLETTLGRPEFLIIPKLINVVVGAVVLFLLIRRWLPREIRAREEWIQRLKSSEELYRDFVEGSDDLVTRVGPDGRFQFVNFKAREVYGLAPADCVGLAAFDFVHPEDRKATDAAFLRWLRDKPAHVTLENRQVSQSGGVKHMLWTVSPHCDESGDVTHLNSIGRDITERKRTEERQRLLATAVEQAAESIVITDVDGDIQYVNPAFEEHTGYSSEDALGENPRILQSGHHDRAFFETLWATLSKGEVWTGRLINKRKDGSLFEEEAAISPVHDSGGALVNYVAVKRDVTREAELEARLVQTQKVETIGTLAGGIAHDFNNLLQVMLGYVELAQANEETNERTSEYLAKIEIAGGRASDLVDQILAFSRQSKQERKPLRVQSILKEVLQLLRSSIPSTIAIRQSIDADCELVVADATEVHQIAINLCTNAFHAMRKRGGVLEVSLKTVTLDDDAASRIPGLEAGVKVRLSVRDTGTGIAAPTLKRIFDPYFTTKGVGEGSGLGLATVHGIVESSGGAITVESVPGVGTLFQVYLPAVPRDEATPPEAPELPLPAGTERILVVDDEPLLVEQIQLGLEALGYRVETHTSAHEALEAFRAEPESFGAILTDQTMPNMTGLELIREVSLIQPSVPVILCTGYSELVNEESAKAAGAREFVKKPVLPRSLAALVRRVIDENGRDPN